MREQAFEAWLRTRVAASTAGNQRANCRRVERTYGDLDSLFATDGLRSLVEHLTYSRADEAARLPPRHSIPLSGDVYSHTAPLLAAVRYYKRFCEDEQIGSQVSPPGRAADPGQPAAPGEPHTRGWPEWTLPAEDDLLALARRITPFVRFLNQDVVSAIVDDNMRRGQEWAKQLAARNIPPDLYLWERCATVFPGVRRFSGRAERSLLSNRPSLEAAAFPHALRIDDNRYPRHVWSFVLRGVPSGTVGPRGYSLAHLADHQAYQSRLEAEFSGPLPELGGLGVPGLFTSATNMAYVPRALVRPTDDAGPLRMLLQRRAAGLYRFANLLPQGIAPREESSSAWHLEAFEWSAPEGTTEHTGALLAYRAETMNALLASS